MTFFELIKYRLQDETGGGGMGFIGAILGGVVGFLVGGPVGAVIGFGIGMGAMMATENLMPADFDIPDNIPDFDRSPTYGSTQIGNTIAEGIPVARCYGQCRIGANKIAFSTKTSIVLNVIYGLCVGEVEGVTSWYVNDIEWSDLNGVCSKETFDGTRTQIVNSTFTPSNSSAYRGMAYVVTEFGKNDSQIGSDPHLVVDIQGLLCAPLAGGANAFTRNNAVILYDWYLNVEGYSAGDINLNSFKSLEALCDAVPAGGSVSRYKFDFSFDTDISINDAKKTIWQSFNGRVIMSQGKLKAVWDSAQMEDGAGGLTAKTVSHAFTVDNIVKDSLKWHQPERPNIIRIHYLDSTAKYKKSSVEVKDEHDISINGEILHEEKCWYITLAEIARRRAQYKFNKFKYTDYVVSLSALSGAGDLEVYDLVTVTHTLPGWTTKQFLVTQKGEDQYGRMQFVLSAYYSGVYDDSEAGDQSGYESDLSNPFDIPYEIAVGDITLTEATSQTFHWSPAIVVTFVEPTIDPFWSHVEVWISTDDITFTFYGITSTGDGFNIETTGAMFQPGATLYVKLLSVSESGVKDSLTNITSKSIVLSSVIRLGTFYVHADTFGNNATAANATILLDSGNTWIRVGASGSDHVLVDGDYGGVPAVRSSNYVSGAAGEGFLLKSDLLEVGNIACRGIFRMAVFQKDVISAIGGNVFISKGADVLDDHSAASGGGSVYGTHVYGTAIFGGATATMTIEGNESFEVGDILRIKDDSDDEWLEVTAIGAAPTYTVTRDKGGDYAADANPAWKKGATVVNYGQSGDGVIYLTASETNGPHISVLTHAGSPWDAITTRLRIGNLNGFLGYASDLYGIAIGETDAYLKYDPTNGLRIRGTIAIESMYSLPSDEDLVGYWSLDDGAGAVAVDNSGNGNDGALLGDPTWISGVAGKCLEGDGTADCVRISNSSDFQMGSSDFSVSAWVYINTGGYTEAWIMGIETPGSRYAISVYPIAAAARIYTYISDGVDDAYNYTGDSTVLLDQWNHIAVVWDRANDLAKAYLNGILDGDLDISAVTGNVNPTGYLYLAASFNGSDALDGKIDEVRIYDTALTESEIKALYLYPSGNKSASISGGQTPWASGSDVTKIDGGNIYTNTITASHINGAGFGTLTITSGKIEINTSDALEIQAAGNVKVLAGGDIKLIGSDTNPGNIFFEGTSYSVKCGSDADGNEFYISPETDDAVSIFIGKDSPWGTGKLAAKVQLASRNTVELYARHPDYPTTATYSLVDLNAATAHSNIIFTTAFGGTARTISAAHTSTILSFYPTVNKVWDLGQATTAWDDAYADDWHNVADFYHLDSRDDLAAIKAIKGSDIISGVTGLELIDDDTIPEWMLSRYKKDGEKWEKGDVMRDADGKPYLSMKLMTSLLMGAIRQLDAKIEKITNP